MRAVAEMHLQLDISVQLANKFIRNNSQNNKCNERIKTFLPLKCVDDIKNIEAQFKNDKTLYNEYVSIISKYLLLFKIS